MNGSQTANMAHGLHGSLDQPADGAQVTEAIKLEGWAFAENGDQLQAEVYCNDTLVFQTDCQMPRYDVEQRFPVFEGAYQSGFLGNITLQDFDDGDYVLRTLAKTPTGEQMIIGTTTIHLEKKVKTTKETHLAERRNALKTMTQGYGSGSEFIQRMIELCDIRPTHKILEVGSHYGRLVVPFTHYLDAAGSFNGLEIDLSAVDYCRRNIAAKNSHFRFTHADVYNKYYNLSGETPASVYRFPFPSESFDFVFLASVFTHMLPSDVENYLGEITRVLRSGGRCLITFFLLNEDSLRVVESGEALHNFQYSMDGFRTTSQNNPEAAIAFDEQYVTHLYQTNGLSIEKPIRYGRWAGKHNRLTNQDVVIAVK